MSGLATLACSGKSDRGSRGGGGDGTGTGTALTSSGGSGGSGDSGGSAGSAAGGASADLRQFHRALFEAGCDFEERCASVNGRRFASRDYCLENVEYLLQFDTLSGIPYVVDLAYTAACIASQYPADSCDAPSPNIDTPACNQALSRADAVGEGGVCFSGATGYRQCDYDLTCEWSGGCGYCARAPARQPDGSPCMDTDDCASESCGPEQTCVPRGERGDPCSSTVACRGNLVCRSGPDASDATTCQDRRAAGESCADDPYLCLHGSSCSEADDVCVPEAQLGAACDRANETCAAVCNFETPDAPTGTCSATYSTAGEPCSYSDGSASCIDGIAEETLGPDGAPIACVCAPQPQLATGSPCSSGVDCESSVCEASDPEDPSAGGLCRDKLHTGEACQYHSTCESGYCTDSGVCEDAPLCD